MNAANKWNIFPLKKSNFLSPSNNIIFLLLYNIFTRVFVFWWFSKDFWRYCEICPKVRWKFLKTSKEDPKMFQSYTNKFKCNFTCVDKNDILTCADKNDILTYGILFYPFVATWYITNFYVINWINFFPSGLVLSVVRIFLSLTTVTVTLAWVFSVSVSFVWELGKK